MLAVNCSSWFDRVLTTQSSRQHADSLPHIPEALYARTEPGATGPPAGYAKSAAPPPTERLDPLLNHHRKTDDTRLKHYFVHLSTTKYSQENTDWGPVSHVTRAVGDTRTFAQRSPPMQ
ncbi:unnamed protein product [Arctogadus glacialis]